MKASRGGGKGRNEAVWFPTSKTFGSVLPAIPLSTIPGQLIGHNAHCLI